MKQKVSVLIPARMASSRFPDKPLARILDLPMIEHVRRRALLSDVVDHVCVATCDQEIARVVTEYGGDVIMTSSAHQRCTDRIEEAARDMDTDIIVMVQGDEPLFIPDCIPSLIDPITRSENTNCTNLVSIIKDRRDLENINVVKTAISLKKNVLYYSRSPIPYFMVNTDAVCYKQTGIAAFTKSFLSQYTRLPPTQLEIAESVDFLRILEHDFSIRGVVSSDETCGVDRKRDVEIVENVLRRDPRQQDYYRRILDL